MNVRVGLWRRLSAEELMFLNCGWRRLLRVPWMARRSNQFIQKEISPGISLEGMMPELKLQYFGHLMQRVDSLEKTLMLGGIGGRRRRGWPRMRWLDGITRESGWTLGVGDGHGGLVCCHSLGRKESDTTERLNWTELNWTELNVAFRIHFHLPFIIYLSIQQIVIEELLVSGNTRWIIWSPYSDGA